MKRPIIALIPVFFALHIHHSFAEVPGFNQQVQAPVLEPTKRGSLVGELSSFAQDGNDLMKGGFRFSLPIKFPEDRGKLLFPIVPSYGVTHGISEWGIGFETNLVITRYRRQGDLKYTDDEFVSPWGTLLKGTDGFFYPEGLQSPVRLSRSEDNYWIAYLEDGTTLTFGGENATIPTKRGTYSWYLTSAKSVLNERSVYTYANPEGPGERPFLSKVRYGGKGDLNQYEVVFVSQKLKTPLIDYRSGEQVTLRRRLDRVTFRVLQSSEFSERFSYLFTYKEPSEGPLFYLVQIKKKYSSGAEEPPLVLDYNYAEDFLKTTKWLPAPGFSPILKQFPNALVPERHSVLSTEDDGQSELEFANTFSRVVLKGGKFELESLPKATDQVDLYCRPPIDTYPPAPRLHSRMKGIGSSLDVVGFETRFKSVEPFEETTLHICNIEGRLIQKVKLTGFDLRPNEYTKLVDLTRKGKPDLVWIGEGNATSPNNQYRSEIRLKVFENISTDDTVAFRAPFEIKLDGLLDRGRSYAMFQDINGDGILDFVLVQSSGIAVWYGKGNYEFEREPAWLSFRLGAWGATFDLYKARINFHDLNGDGLPDAIVQTDTGASIFINQGNRFVLQNKGPLVGRSWGGHSGAPVVVDLLGTGNVQIAAQDLRLNHVNVIELSEPGTGLLKAIDDGKGNQVRLNYQRVPGSPGIGYRFPVLNQMSLTVSGEGARTETYFFSEPKHHSLDRGFLGFSQVIKESALGAFQYIFQYGDQQPGILLSKQETDLKVPNLVRTLEHEFAEASHFGISWLRKSSTLSGFQEKTTEGKWNTFSGHAHPSTGSMEQTTLIFEERETCPSAVRVQTASGTAFYEIKYFDSPQFKLSLSCVLDSFNIFGTHQQSEMDFSEGLKLSRNEQGQPLNIVRLGTYPKILQTIEYTPDFQTQAITVPGMGRTEFQYNPLSTLLESIITPDGTARKATRNPLHDQLIHLAEHRGKSSIHSQEFEFDAFERLSKSFERNSSTSTIHSGRSFRYSYATSSTPGWIEEFEEILGDDNKATRTKVGLLSGSGNDLGTLLRLGQIAALVQLKSKDSEKGLMIDFSSKSLTFESFLSHPDYINLYSDALMIHQRSVGSFNLEQKELQLHQAGITGSKDFEYQTDSNRVVKHLIENDSFRWTTYSDEKERVTSRIFPNGARYDFEYDLLGRISRLTLPSGEFQQVQYNSFGEISRISRSRIGAIAYSYQQFSSLLENKHYLSDKSEVIRTEAIQYDSQGRKKTLTYLDPKSHSDEIFQYYYDGVLPNGSSLQGQNGRLTALVGPQFYKIWNYREDGKLLWEKVIIENFCTLTSYFSYRSDGSIQSTGLVRQGLHSEKPLELEIKYRLDSFGRESQASLNDQILYTLAYDDLSKVVAAKGDQAELEFYFDSETQKTRGFKQNMPDSAYYSTSWNLDRRGHLVSEKFSTSKHEINQSYKYSDVGYLSSYLGAQGEISYGYDEQQAVSHVTKNGESLNIQSQENRWKTEAGHYELDGLGRVIKKDIHSQQLHMEYGPQGRLTKAVKFPHAELTYLYDDEGRRIIKKRGGKIAEVYIGNMLLTPDQLLIPIQINGTPFAYLENGTLKWISPDMRGTVLSDDGISLNVPEPFGARSRDSSNTPRTAFLEYSLLGYDSDLQAYRAAHRDYDPFVKRFLTPDPLFFEHPEKCIESPIECGLYGYAKNSPLSFVDPTGLFTEPNKALGSNQIVIDGFISQSTVGPPGMQFQGDGRAFGPHATTPDQSRLTVWIDPQSQTATHHVSDSHRAGSPQGYEPDPNNVINVNFGHGIITVDINAKNSAMPFPASLVTPSITNHFTFINSEGGWHGTMTGNAFPSWEVNNWSNGFAMPMMESMEKPGPINGPFHLFNFTTPRTVTF